MAKTNRPKGKRSRNTTIRCEWCGEHRECTREDTKTCGDRCRARLSFYVRSLGYPPDELPGRMTGQQAVDLEIFRLITNERRRREAAAAERKAYLSTAIGRRLSGIDAAHPTTGGPA